MRINLYEKYQELELYEKLIEDTNPSSAMSAVILAEEDIKDEELVYKAYKRFYDLLMKSSEPAQTSTAAYVAKNYFKNKELEIDAWIKTYDNMLGYANKKDSPTSTRILFAKSAAELAKNHLKNDSRLEELALEQAEEIKKSA